MYNELSLTDNELRTGDHETLLLTVSNLEKPFPKELNGPFPMRSSYWNRRVHCLIMVYENNVSDVGSSSVIMYKYKHAQTDSLDGSGDNDLG